MALNVKLFRFHKSSLSRYYSYPALKYGKFKATHNICSPTINFDSELENIYKIAESIKIRKLELDIFKLKTSWKSFKNIKRLTGNIKTELKELDKDIKILNNNGEDENVLNDLRRIKLQIDIVKKEIEKLAIAVENATGKLNSYGLMIPNVMHKETPRDEDELVYEYGKPSELPNALGHLKIGENLDVLNYKDASCFFLKNEAAQFEIYSSSFIADVLKKNDFIFFSNPDFVKRVVIEGSGVNLSLPNNIFTLKDKMDKENAYTVHLVGGSSIYPFCAFHASQTLHSSCLPLKYFSIGRQYNRNSLESEFGLYETWQKTVSEIFILTRNDPDEMMNQFENLLNLVKSIYEKFNYHFRIAYIKAIDLEPSEILRASFQMYSTHHQKYIELGNISMIDDYFSRRLLMNYEKGHKNYEFTKIITGTIVNLTKLLAFVLEENNNAKKFFMPQCLQSYSFL